MLFFSLKVEVELISTSVPNQTPLRKQRVKQALVPSLAANKARFGRHSRQTESAPLCFQTSIHLTEAEALFECECPDTLLVLLILLQCSCHWVNYGLVYHAEHSVMIVWIICLETVPWFVLFAFHMLSALRGRHQLKAELQHCLTLAQRVMGLYAQTMLYGPAL